MGAISQNAMITKSLVDKSNGLFILSPENTDSRYSKHDDGGVEVEVGELLYSMVRILKPQHILETGTYSGISALYMAQALKENNSGDIITLEIDSTHKLRAEKLWKACEVEKYVGCIMQNSLDYELPGMQYDMMFLDSEPEVRFKELVKFFPCLKPGGYVFLHDLPRGFCEGNVNPDHPEYKNWPWGELPNEIKQWLKNGDLVKFHLPNPREMVGFYKRRKDDYEVR